MRFNSLIYHLLPLPLLTNEGSSQPQNRMLAVARQMEVIQMRKIFFFHDTKVIFELDAEF